jgi:centromeric protein E
MSEENINVCIRMRPATKGRKKIWRCVPEHNASTQAEGDAKETPVPGASFQFGTVYDDTYSTVDLHNNVAKRIVESAVDGINGTIFAYGQTSSGRTFTMQGAPGVEGILHKAVETIFSRIQAPDDREFLLRVSYVEIYNEVIRGLLNPGEPLKVREGQHRWGGGGGKGR